MGNLVRSFEFVGIGGFCIKVFFFGIKCLVLGVGGFCFFQEVSKGILAGVGFLEI